MKRLSNEDRLRRRQGVLRRYEEKRRAEKLGKGFPHDLPAFEKRCSRCGRVRPWRDFSTKPTTRDGLHSSCRACNVAAAGASALRNPEKVRAHKGAWKARNPEKVREQQRKDNLKAYARHGAKLRARVREYAARNKEKIKARYTSPRGRMLRRFSQQRRMARMAGAVNDLTIEQWEALVARFDGRCAYCGEPWTEIDHVVPVAKGGGLTRSNVLPACRPCNVVKNARSAEVFCEDRGLSLSSILAKAGLDGAGSRA